MSELPTVPPAAPPAPAAAEPLAIQTTDTGRAARKLLAREVQAALLDIQDELAANPDAYPARTRTLSADGSIRVYSHPDPVLEVTFQVDAAARILRLTHFAAPTVPVTKRVFISYSHQDQDWLVKIKKFLVPLEDQGLIRLWVDTEITAGTPWLQEIQTQLKGAKVAVLLLTQNFLSSPFIKQEELDVLLKAAQEGGCMIFWIAVSSSTYEDTPLKWIQSANPPDRPLDMMTPAEQNKVLVEIYRKMKTAVAPG